MKRTILALKPLLPDEMLLLEERYDVIRLWEERDPESVLQVRGLDIQGIVAAYSYGAIHERLMAALPNLEIIAQCGVGYDNIDIEAAHKRGIVVTNTPNVVTNDTADMAIFLILALARRAVEADMFVRVGRWNSGLMPCSTSLSGKTVGIVGLGRIGAAVARRAESFDMRIVYHSLKQKEDVPYPYYDSLENMARDSDFLVLTCAGGAGTQNLITYKILDALGAKGYLINIARGSVVAEEDLLIALKNKTIAGAGLDVFAHEPYVPEELYKMDHVVLSPHMGASTLETKSKMGHLVLDNLDSYFSGGALPTLVKFSKAV